MSSGSTEHDSRPDQGLSRTQRLYLSRDFQEAYAQNRKFHGRYIVMWLLERENAALKLGVVASRRVGNAPLRAQAKRRLREIFRKNRSLCSGNVDVVLVARKAINTATWDEVLKDFMNLAQKAGIRPRSADGKPN